MMATSTVAGPAQSQVRAGTLASIFSFPAMLVSLLIMLAILTVRDRFDDPDMWWHLKTGQAIWTAHSIPQIDLFSYTTNHHSYIPHEWLSQLTIYSAYRLSGGYSGLMLWLCALTAAILIFAYILCAIYARNPSVALLGALVVWFFGTVGFAVRPQMVGYLLLIVELTILHLGCTRNRYWFWALPPLFAIWVNCHGSFSLGLAVAGILLASSFIQFDCGALRPTSLEKSIRRTLFKALTVSLLALFANPTGSKLVFYPFAVMLGPSAGVANVSEWLPLQFENARAFGFLGLLLCIFLTLSMRRSKLFWHELLLILFAAWLAASHRRLLFPFGILIAPIVTRLIAEMDDAKSQKQTRPLLNAGLMALSLVAAWRAFPGVMNLQKQVQSFSPVRAVQYIQANHLPGPILNAWNFGGYLIWSAPEYPVFIDGRSDVFEWTGVIDEFGRWATVQSRPSELLDKYHVNLCIVDRGSPPSIFMLLLPDWKEVYSDEVAAVFVRTTKMVAAH